MTGLNSPEPTRRAAPDLAAIRVHEAARTPEQRAARQARLAARRNGLAALAHGDEYLARGDLDTAHSWFEIAAAHEAPDAHRRLSTVAVLADATRTAELAAAADGTPLATNRRAPHLDRDTAVERLEAAAELILAAQERAARIDADTDARVQRTLAEAAVTAKQTITDAENKAVRIIADAETRAAVPLAVDAEESRGGKLDLVWSPHFVGRVRHSIVIQFKHPHDIDVLPALNYERSTFRARWCELLEASPYFTRTPSSPPDTAQIRGLIEHAKGRWDSGSRAEVAQGTCSVPSLTDAADAGRFEQAVLLCVALLADLPAERVFEAAMNMKTREDVLRCRSAVSRLTGPPYLLWVPASATTRDPILQQRVGRVTRILADVERHAMDAPAGIGHAGMVQPDSVRRGDHDLAAGTAHPDRSGTVIC